jgi:hypothetical protein
MTKEAKAAPVPVSASAEAEVQHNDPEVVAAQFLDACAPGLAADERRVAEEQLVQFVRGLPSGSMEISVGLGLMQLRVNDVVVLSMNGIDAQLRQLYSNDADVGWTFGHMESTAAALPAESPLRHIAYEAISTNVSAAASGDADIAAMARTEPHLQKYWEPMFVAAA